MTVYTQTARFDTARALTEGEMRKIAPSIFATDAHHSRSERFRPIPTIEVLRGVIKEGFMPVGVKQSTTRDPGKAAFTKHLIRLRKIDDAPSYRVGDTVCEVLLKNANDGTSAYDLLAGLFRITCMNSLVSQVGTVDTVKVRHSGDVQAKVIEGTFKVLGNAQQALVAPAEWSRLNLDAGERRIIAETAHALRFADADGEVTTAVPVEQMLRIRRIEDVNPNLWNVFNVVQENAIRGGLTGIGPDANNRPRRTTTREVKGIDQDIKLNRALWTMAAKFAELKGIAHAA